jgi:hypothetical protein
MQISIKVLQSMILELNNTLGIEPIEGQRYTPGMYVLHEGFGGSYSLREVTSVGGGQDVIFCASSKKELYGLIRSYVYGIKMFHPKYNHQRWKVYPKD